MHQMLQQAKRAPSVATLAAAGLMFSQTAALADLQIRFSEGAPKDRFTVLNTGKCDMGPATVIIDLSGSKAGLIFDVTASGKGVEVFQPFEVVSGNSYLLNRPAVKDGDNRVRLDLSGLPVNKTVSFTIDVDDTIGAREITVSGSEIEGAIARVQIGTEKGEAQFSQNAIATLPISSCKS